MRKTFASAVAALMSAVALLLLLVCANIGGLMVARAQNRTRETAIRVSLGATRWRLLSGTLWEALLLSITGAAGGWIIARLGGPILLRFLPQRRPLGIELIPDWRVLGFAIGACVVTALTLTALPAMHTVRTDTSLLLNQTSGRIAGRRVGRWLVALQIAIATLLGLGGLSLVQTLQALRAQDPGFRRERVIVATINGRMAGLLSAQLPGTYREVTRRAESIPGVTSVSIAERALMRGVGFKATAGPAGARVTFADAMNISLNGVSAGYFSSLGMSIVEGRGLRTGDSTARPRPVVVSRSFARQFFPGTSATGRLFGTGSPGTVIPPSSEIVGVVNDAKYRSMREVPPPTVYSLLDDEGLKYSDGIALHLVTIADPKAVIGHLRVMLNGIGPGLVPTDVATMEQEIETSLWQERLLATLAETLAGFAILLAGIGLFGMLAYSVASRTREIGTRIVVGAMPRHLAAMVLQDAARPVAVGLLLGVLLYYFFSKLIASLLFGIAAWDPLSIAGALSAVVTVSLAGALIPVLRAIAIQPAELLRSE